MAEKTMEQDMMSMMMVIMMIAVISQLLTGQVQAAPPVAGDATVTLTNPPSGAEFWSLSLCDWDLTTSIHFIGRNGKQRVDIAEAVSFEIPSGLNFPLRIIALQVTKWNEAKTALTVLYEVQSFRPYLWDWDKGDWGDEPDPKYKEAFLPAYGVYSFDVGAEAFITMEIVG